MKKRYIFPAIFTYEEGQEIAVGFPDLDVATSGTDDNNALLSARELLGCALYGMEEDGVEIPVSTPLSDIKTAENERSVLVDVYMPSIRMAKINRSVNRTVTLPAYTAPERRDCHGIHQKSCRRYDYAYYQNVSCTFGNRSQAGGKDNFAAKTGIGAEGAGDRT